jgi:hypothetical protein
MSETEASNAELRKRLARLGVPLFEPTAPIPDDSDPAGVLVALLRSGDPRLVASIPCLIVIGERTGGAAERASRRLDPGERERFGLLHYVARCLAASRAPDLRDLGVARVITPIDSEPGELPDVTDQFGERGLARADDRDRGLVGDAVDLFDTCLRALRLERGPRAPARRG